MGKKKTHQLVDAILEPTRNERMQDLLLAQIDEAKAKLEQAVAAQGQLALLVRALTYQQFVLGEGVPVTLTPAMLAKAQDGVAMRMEAGPDGTLTLHVEEVEPDGESAV